MSGYVHTPGSLRLGTRLHAYLGGFGASAARPRWSPGLRWQTAPLRQLGCEFSSRRPKPLIAKTRASRRGDSSAAGGARLRSPSPVNAGSDPLGILPREELLPLGLPVGALQRALLDLVGRRSTAQRTSLDSLVGEGTGADGGLEAMAGPPLY